MRQPDISASVIPYTAAPAALRSAVPAAPPAASAALRSAASSLLLLSALLFTACGCAVPSRAPESSAASSAETLSPPEIIVSSPPAETEPESAAAEQPPKPGLVRSPLTHAWVTEENAAKRPIAVMFPIDRKAQPQYGISRAEIFYEIMEEGTMSRQMGILQDWEDLERIGNIRSIRDYFIYEALEWDAILVHFGGPEIFVKPMLTRADVENINGVGGILGDSYNAFFRIPKNSRSEHTAYTDGKRLLAAIERAGFSRTHRKEYWQPARWKFASAEAPRTLEDHPDAVSATELDMKESFPVTRPTLHYDSTNRLYYRSIYGKPQTDAATGEQLAFSNVLIESAVSGRRGASEYLYFHVLDSVRDGWYMTGGRMIHVHWVKNSDYEPTRFYDDDGNEITLNAGKTMIFITREGKDSFIADGVRYAV